MASLDLFWLENESLVDNDPAPEVIAQDDAEDPEAALERFALIAADPGVRPRAKPGLLTDARRSSRAALPCAESRRPPAGR